MGKEETLYLLPEGMVEGTFYLLLPPGYEFVWKKSNLDMIITNAHETQRTREHVSVMEMNSTTQSARNSTRK